MQPIRIGVVGAGSTGARQALAVAALPNATLVGVHDIESERSRKLADRCGGQSFDRLADLIDVVDAVTVATPAETHPEIAEQVLAAGRYAFVATPLAGSLLAAQRMLDLAQRSAEPAIQVGHVDCFDPTFRALRALIGGDRPYGATFRRTVPLDPSGEAIDVVRDLMIQDIYLAIEVFGHDIAKIDAFGASERGGRPDLAIVELLLDDGREVKLVASRVGQAAITTIDVETDRALFQADLRAASILEQARDAPLDDAVTHSARPADPIQAELEHFVACIYRGRKPAVDARAGFNVLVYVDAIDQLIARTRVRDTVGLMAMAER
jgi:predicted dehydrogenase